MASSAAATTSVSVHLTPSPSSEASPSTATVIPTTLIFQRAFSIADVGMWKTIAGSLPFEPTINALVYYFPHAHVENLWDSCDIGLSRVISDEFKESYLCRIKSVSFHGDVDTEDVFAKFVLEPMEDSETPYWDPTWTWNLENEEELPLPAPTAWSKVLSMSDLNKRLRLTVSASESGVFPPRGPGESQKLVFTDLLRNTWKFQHSYSIADRCCYISKGWIGYVSKKQLLVDDTIHFKRNEDTSLSVAFSRKTNIGANSYQKFCADLNKEFNVEGFVVREALKLAKESKCFEVIFYPKRTDFLVAPKIIREALRKLRRCKDMGCLGVKASIDGKEFQGVLIDVADRNGWKNTMVQWVGDNDVTLVNAWQIEPEGFIPQ